MAQQQIEGARAKIGREQAFAIDQESLDQAILPVLRRSDTDAAIRALAGARHLPFLKAVDEECAIIEQASTQISMIDPKARAEDLLIAALRMRPDRIILGELRGVEAFTFLRAVNTGHPGSMTSIHADTPQRAIEQLSLLVLQAGSKLARDDVRHYVRESVDVFVQLERRGGKRRLAQILNIG